MSVKKKRSIIEVETKRSLEMLTQQVEQLKGGDLSLKQIFQKKNKELDEILKFNKRGFA
jgi:hypothetical protein